ncbi:FMN-binding protein [Desulfitobacterium hafniense]|uniref:FMN-binding domain protein n=3 Tax=root TaxID=1 RepID=A0A098AWM7_DESHA|nr:FMN-binding protein [Desulfitobacterium hafniense]EHL05815.1 FMN-binding domain protein [Desulfitobacterium hafniense DP7]KTE90444.1 FMN-binding protein [Desulfitobacterium hafniense]MEA5021750.1 FMN-binding protein [Desulfitobacterium hafniense]CDX01039.1 FMN-binding domain protein [Desulfitobacterium hafniense]
MSKLKKTLTAIVCVMLTLSLAGCSEGAKGSANQAKEKKQLYTPGDYIAQAEGKDGPVKVKVTFSKSEITAIDILKQTETPGLGDEALKTVAEQIKGQQSLSVDTVSGATLSSQAMLTAVEDCVEQAGADPEQLKEGKQ